MNETNAVNLFDRSKVVVGDYTYGPLRVIDGANNSQLEIGAFCSIAEDVTFILNGDHPVDRITTFPLRAFVLREEEQVGSRGNIIVFDDVWIGHGAIVLSGVTLGRGSVIAAGSVVTRDVEPYSIVAGVPARHVRQRVPAAVQAGLEAVDLAALTPDVVRTHLDLLESSLTSSDVDRLKSFTKALHRRPSAPSVENEVVDQQTSSEEPQR